MERSACLISPALRIGAQAHYRGIRQVSLQAVLFGSLLTRKLATRLRHVAQTVLQAGLYASLLHQGNSTNRSKAFSAYPFAIGQVLKECSQSCENAILLVFILSDC